MHTPGPHSPSHANTRARTHTHTHTHTHTQIHTNTHTHTRMHTAPHLQLRAALVDEPRRAQRRHRLVHAQPAAARQTHQPQPGGEAGLQGGGGRDGCRYQPKFYRSQDAKERGGERGGTGSRSQRRCKVCFQAFTASRHAPTHTPQPGPPKQQTHIYTHLSQLPHELRQLAVCAAREEHLGAPARRRGAGRGTQRAQRCPGGGRRVQWEGGRNAAGGGGGGGGAGVAVYGARRPNNSHQGDRIGAPRRRRPPPGAGGRGGSGGEGEAVSWAEPQNIGPNGQRIAAQPRTQCRGLRGACDARYKITQTQPKERCPLTQHGARSGATSPQTQPASCSRTLDSCSHVLITRHSP